MSELVTTIQQKQSPTDHSGYVCQFRPIAFFAGLGTDYIFNLTAAVSPPRDEPILRREKKTIFLRLPLIQLPSGLHQNVEIGKYARFYSEFNKIGALLEGQSNDTHCVE